MKYETSQEYLSVLLKVGISKCVAFYKMSWFTNAQSSNRSLFQFFNSINVLTKCCGLPMHIAHRSLLQFFSLIKVFEHVNKVPNILVQSNMDL